MEEAVKKIEDVREIHKRGGFEIRGFLSNSEDVLRRVDPTSGNEQLAFGQEEYDLERVLGLYWDPKTDMFRFKKRFRTVDAAVVNGERSPTKREVLKLLMCIFYPLGFLSHLSIRGKILIQDIWRMGIGWDEKIPDCLFTKWKNFVAQLEDLDKVQIPRCYGVRISQAENIQLHIFCDASEQGICCCAYFRVTVHGEVKSNIIFAKSKVSPLKAVSIPRLELEAALVAARISSWIVKNHDIKPSRIVIWTDSRNVLCWLRSEDPRRFKPFVSHRIGEILELTEVSSWRWVPTADNVADDGTRDHTPVDISRTCRFFNGPSFLQLSESQWPVEVVKAAAKPEDLEVKRDLQFLNVEKLPELDLTLSWTDLICELAKIKKQGAPTVEDLSTAEEELLNIPNPLRSLMTLPR